MKWILLWTYVQGSQISIEHVEFSEFWACKEASEKVQILAEYDMSRIRAICVPKGADQ